MSALLWLAGAPVRATLVGLLLGYQATVGRLVPGRCRFHPSCSAYALEAVRTHGAAKGSALAIWRVLRCSPLTAGGLDPVPPRGTWRRPRDTAVVR
ncbi:MAG TPA: membrane protein insertion efficiency factor YidD [Actinomycetota bacterium]|nr:membrane protein insertion efficiency factor YidD [Actinomycetota bacterium]